MNRKLPSGIYVVAQSSLAGPLDDAFGRSVHVVSLDVSAPVPDEVLKGASILVLEVDPDSTASLARVADVRASRPGMPLIVALGQADLAMTRTLIRQGISDVASLPFDLDELTALLLEAGARLAPKDHVSLAPMVSLVRATGGVGATSVITHLADSLVHSDGRRREVCIIDLDLQFGQVSNYLGLNPTTTVLDLLEAHERLDSDLIRDAAMMSSHGIAVIGAPTVIAPLEEVDVDRLLNLLTIARQTFDFVLLDLPANWTSWTLSAALACNDIFVVTDQSITGLRQTKRVIELFDALQVSRENVRIIVNRVGKKLFQAISVNEVADTLNRPVSATIARDKGELQMAQDQGHLLADTNRKAAFVKDVDKLADQICERIGRTAA